MSRKKTVVLFSCFWGQHVCLPSRMVSSLCMGSSLVCSSSLLGILYVKVQIFLAVPWYSSGHCQFSSLQAAVFLTLGLSLPICEIGRLLGQRTLPCNYLQSCRVNPLPTVRICELAMRCKGRQLWFKHQGVCLGCEKLGTAREGHK